MGAVRGKDGREIKALRRLGAVKPVAAQGAGDDAVAPVPQRIGDCQRRGRGGVRLQRLQHRRDHALADQRPRHVMDQDAGHPSAVERLQPRAHRGIAAVAASHALNVRVVCRVFHVIGMQHQHDAVDAGGVSECRQSPIGDPLPGQHPPLFGHSAAGTQAASGGNDQGGGGHGCSGLGRPCLGSLSRADNGAGRLPKMQAIVDLHLVHRCQTIAFPERWD